MVSCRRRSWNTLLKSPQCPVVPRASGFTNAYLSAMLDKGHLFCCQMGTRSNPHVTAPAVWP